MYHRDIKSVKQANKKAGHHFFDPSAMEFFDSRIEGPLMGGRYFITSEQFHMVDGSFSGVRHYTIREAREDGRINTVGEFGAYATVRAAGIEVERLMKKGK